MRREPGKADYLNTQGVARYSVGEYKEAIAALEQSLALGKGQSDALDLHFLAMGHAKLGDRIKEKECFDRAELWARGRANLPPEQIEELKRFRAEAERVLASE